MKKLAFSLIAVLAVTGVSFAGHEYVRSGKEYKTTYPEKPPCFKDMELQLDIFGSYNDGLSGADHRFTDNFGGGVGVNAFILRYLGIGIDANWANSSQSSPGHKDVTHAVAGSAILRYPLEIGNHFCLAPYIFGGGGGIWDGTTIGEGHAGGGLEWRAHERWGIFTDGRYIWTGGHNNDIVTIRAGLRLVF